MTGRVSLCGASSCRRRRRVLEIYGTELSRETISKITGQTIDDMLAWQSRPLVARAPASASRPPDRV